LKSPAPINLEGSGTTFPFSNKIKPTLFSHI
jgi:hypothetical protein